MFGSRHGESSFRKLYHFRDEYAAGRSYELIHLVLSTVVGNLSGGLFYTRFLLLNGINMVNVGIMTFVPYIAAMFSVFSPRILQHFPRRKWVLAAFKSIYYVIHILGITLLPEFVHDPGARLAWFVGIIFVSGVINALNANGYTVWYANFLPDKLRSDYFAIRDNINYLFGMGFAILIAVFADMFSETPYEKIVIVGIRYLALILAFLDVFFLSRPREYPYPQTVKKNKMVNIVRLPLNNKRFSWTMALTFFCVFINNFPSGVLNYHLVNAVGIQYSYVYFINICYSVFLTVFLPHWNRILARHGWFRTYALSTLMLVPTYIMYAWVTPENYLWLFLLLRFIQHYIGVGRNTTFANFPYINLPEQDRDDFIVFYSLGTNLAAGLGVLVGTSIISLIGEKEVTLLNHAFSAVPILMLIEAAATLLICALTIRLLPRIEPIDE